MGRGAVVSVRLLGKSMQTWTKSMMRPGQIINLYELVAPIGLAKKTELDPSESSCYFLKTAHP